ncbi:MAG: Bug family tripartite tricarboxylate transporter substrate binding protein [Gemmatimonas sp.]
MRLLHWAIASAFLCLLVHPTDLRAADFYKGKTVNLIVGFSAGGGYDQYTRLLARHYADHIPGKPDVIVNNMPGASGLKAVQYLDSGAPKDGTAIVAYNSGLITQSMTLPGKIKVNLANYGYVGSITEDIRMCYMWGATGVKTFAEMQKRPKVVFGETGRGSSAYVNERILKEVFGVKLQQVLGYPGSAEKRLAIERGELDGDCGSYSSLPEEWLRDSKINILIRFNRHVAPGMSDKIPFSVDLARNEDEKKLLQLFAATGDVGRPYIASREVPVDRLAVLRKAFSDTVKDPQFLADAKKQHLDVIEPMNGEAAQRAVADLYQTPKTIVAQAKEITGD